MLTVMSAQNGLVEKIREIVRVHIRAQDNRSTPSAVTTIGPALGHKSFAPE
jgi:hypothetical protein